MGFSAMSETETAPLQSMPSKPHPPLHNFSLPFLKWGGQRLLRCMKPDQAVDRRSPPFESESNGSGASPIRTVAAQPKTFRKPSTPTSFEKLRSMARIGASKSEGEADDDGIEEIRERLLDHLRSAADKMSFRVPEDEESTAMPWNLRTRRAACKAPTEIGGMPLHSPAPLPPPPPSVQENQTRSMRSRAAATAAAAAAQGGDKMKEKRKFSVALLREEIEEDFYAMTGSKPARRPKKRLGKATFPGLWLSDITPDSYNVPEVHESRKR
ncbi:uncharacterized protein LOC131235056 isoform X2 [Magnolia sinica]|uniref:uncharacterized protein LOC131235056 isoform X2 n=1 Tax=Magnolia sinica TaxID=86752 RepID=UPI002657AF9C|nr:uncharacterized protein LOC131235056 isoform X2 [Magnolia sinica]